MEKYYFYSSKPKKCKYWNNGKYVDLKDAYKSLDEALIHGGISNNVKVLKRIDSENLNQIKSNLYLKM